MAITWLFSQHEKSISVPVINDQLADMDEEVLSLRNPWAVDSVFMGKLYVAFNALASLFLIWMYFEIPTASTDSSERQLFVLVYVSGGVVLFTFFALLTWYRVFYITRRECQYFCV